MVLSKYELDKRNEQKHENIYVSVETNLCLKIEWNINKTICLVRYLIKTMKIYSIDFMTRIVLLNIYIKWYALSKTLKHILFFLLNNS